MKSRLSLLSAIIIAISLVGCFHTQLPEPSVSSIRFEVEDSSARWMDGSSNFHIRNAMLQKRSPFGAYFTWWIEKSMLDRDLLEDDGRRIEVWYAHRGYFDSEFLGWDVIAERYSDNGDPSVVRIVGHVRAGEPSYVRQVTINGLSAHPVLEAKAARTIIQPVGDVFELSLHETAISETINMLQDRGFAGANVVGRVDAYPSQSSVDITYNVTGVESPSVFGEVEVLGASQVPMSIVENDITITAGAPFRPSDIADTQARIFALGAFSMVRVLPEISLDSNVVPVRVELTPAASRQLKLGMGLGLESGEQNGRLSSRYTDTNLMRKLWRLDVEVELGYKTFANLSSLGLNSLGNIGSGSPFALGDFSITTPMVFGTRWSFTQEFELERGVEEASEFFRWRIMPSLSRQFGSSLTTISGWRLENWQGDFDEMLDLADGEASGAYRISALVQTFIWDSRDNPLTTRRGDLIEVTLTEAGLFAGYKFAAANADFRHYRPVRSIGGTLSSRMSGAIALPWGSGELSDVPYPERFRSGGSTSVRGWVTDHLGPLVCEADECVGVGGEVRLEGNLQLRFPAIFGFDAVTFFDAGMVWSDVSEVDLAEIQPSAGLGLRFDTPVGPLRFDYARRLIDAPEFSSEPMYALHVGISEAF